MPPDSLLRRVRWGNVARLLALPAVVLLVVLWPRLSPAPPRLPEAGPAPVAGVVTQRTDAAAVSHARAETLPKRRRAGARSERPRRARSRPRRARRAKSAPRTAGGSKRRQRRRPAARSKRAALAPRSSAAALAQTPAAPAPAAPAPQPTAPHRAPPPPPDPLDTEFGTP